MRAITWLHISDLHLRDSQAWEQDVVLAAMCRDIERHRTDAGVIDFILVTGDLAFAGKATEYERAAGFLDEVTRAAGTPRQRIFCVPGNHDVDRSRQKMCFVGARQSLQSQNAVDSFLGSRDELPTLLERQESYRRFQETYFAGQEKEQILDGLGYVAAFAIGDVRLAIVGINTAWLSEGGSSDHGKLLAGERQVIDALDIAGKSDAHIVIAMGHHPLHLLSEFDRRTIQRRVEESCHFYHCGHLHDPESRDTANAGARCVTIAAGASFESRHAHNAYCVIELDLMRAQQTFKTIQYRPSDGAFSYQNNRTSPFIVNSVSPYPVAELGDAIATLGTSLPYYLAALLTESKADLPIEVGNVHIFGTLELLRDQTDSQLTATTLAFMNVRNPLRLFGRRMTLSDFMRRYGEAIRLYGVRLSERSKTDPELRRKLEERESDARVLAKVQPQQANSHTLALLRDLAASHDWEALRERAERTLDSPEELVATEARRMFALCLSQSSADVDKVKAIELYNEVSSGLLAVAEDFAALAMLLIAANDLESAKRSVLDGMKRFPLAADGLSAIGQEIVAATGDRAFRDRLSARRTARTMA